MDIIQGIQNYTSSSKSILTIGTFDGVHMGHQKIINALANCPNASQKLGILPLNRLSNALDLIGFLFVNLGTNDSLLNFS